jgi:hypothetical protein
MYPILVLAVIALSAPLFAKFAGYELRRKPFELVGAAGLFFLLAVAFNSVPVPAVMIVFYWGFVVSYFIGWLMLLIGAVWALMDVATIPEHAERA